MIELTKQLCKNHRDVTDAVGTQGMVKSMQISTKVDPLPGSLHSRYVRCGTAGCHCMTSDELHGPYFRRFWREDGRTRSVYVPLADVPQVAAACARYGELHLSKRAFRRMVRDLARRSDQILAAIGALRALEREREVQ